MMKDLDGLRPPSPRLSLFGWVYRVGKVEKKIIIKEKLNLSISDYTLIHDPLFNSPLCPISPLEIITQKIKIKLAELDRQ